jgi:hypothetical protein
MDPNAGAGANRAREYPVIDTVCAELKNFFRSLEPSPEVRQHFRNARLEVLKGVRQIIDNRIEYLNRRSDTGQNIPVE